MVNAIVLINARRGAVDGVAQQLTEIKGVTEVYSVAGEYDLVAVIRAPGNDELASLVTDGIRKVRGIRKTVTLMAFRTHSKYALEHMFSIGMEESHAPA